MKEETSAYGEHAPRTREGRSVLLVEDNDDHAELIRRALLLTSRAHRLVRLEDGEQALRHVFGADGVPAAGVEYALILLDLRLPGVGGLEVLRRLRDAQRTLTVPVVVLTTSDAEADIAAAYQNGAHAYVVKPVDFKSFGELVRDLSRFWLEWNKLPVAGS